MWQIRVWKDPKNILWIGRELDVAYAERLMAARFMRKEQLNPIINYWEGGGWNIEIVFAGEPAKNTP